MVIIPRMKNSRSVVLFATLLIASTSYAAVGFEYEEKFTSVADTWDFAFPGGDTGPVLITRCGELHYIALDGTKTLLGDIGSYVECKQQQAGATGLTFDRGITDAGFAYVYYTVEGQISSAVARIPLTKNGDSVTLDTSSFQPIIEGLPFALNDARNSGGLALSGSGNHLFVATGDNNTINQAKLAQDLTAFHGKLLRFNIDGTIPTDNPSLGDTTGALKAIYAVGFGRPYRIGIDPLTDAIFVADSARFSWSEVSLVPSGGGGNYGWPEIEGDGHTGPGGVEPIENPVAPLWETPKSSDGALLIVGPAYRPPESATGGLPETLHGYVPVAVSTEPWLKLIGPNGELVETEPGLFGTRSIAIGPDGEFWVLEAQKNVISRLVWADEPPTITMDEPAVNLRYRGEQTINLAASGNDPEDGTNVSSFAWTLSLYDGQDTLVESVTIEGPSGTYSLPLEVDIVRRLEIQVTARDTIGNIGTATRTLVPDASRITFNSEPAGVPFEVDGAEITEEIERVYEPNTPLDVTCPFEYTFEDDPDAILYVFLDRSDEKGADDTFVVPSDDFTLTCKYRRFDEPVVADDGEAVEPVVIDLGRNEPTTTSPSNDGCTTGRGGPSRPWGILVLMVGILGIFRRRVHFTA